MRSGSIQFTTCTVPYSGHNSYLWASSFNSARGSCYAVRSIHTMESSYCFRSSFFSFIFRCCFIFVLCFIFLFLFLVLFVSCSGRASDRARLYSCACVCLCVRRIYIFWHLAELRFCLCTAVAYLVGSLSQPSQRASIFAVVLFDYPFKRLCLRIIQ